jgi:hypothetical protein
MHQLYPCSDRSPNKCTIGGTNGTRNCTSGTAPNRHLRNHELELCHVLARTYSSSSRLASPAHYNPASLKSLFDHVWKACVHKHPNHISGINVQRDAIPSYTSTYNPICAAQPQHPVLHQALIDLYSTYPQIITCGPSVYFLNASQ